MCLGNLERDVGFMLGLAMFVIFILLALYPIGFFVANVMVVPWWSFNWYMCVVGILGWLTGTGVLVLSR